MTHPKDVTYMKLLDSSRHQTPSHSLSSVGGTGAMGWIITISCDVCIKGQLCLRCYEFVRDLRSGSEFKTFNVQHCRHCSIENTMHILKEINFQILYFLMCPFLNLISLRMSLGSQLSFSHFLKNGIPPFQASVLCVTLGINSSRVPNKQVNGNTGFREAGMDN